MLRLDFTEADKRVLARERIHHHHPRVRLRMEVLWLKSQGLAHQEVARLAGVSAKTMRSYFRQYVEGGVARLKELRFRQPQSELLNHQEAITAHFRAHPPASINEAVAAISDLTGLSRSPTQVRLFLKEKCGMRRRKTGTLPAKADPEVQELFKKKELEPRLEEAQAGKRAVFFIDAAHFVLGAFAAILWCHVRVWIKAPSGRQRFNVLGALNAVTQEVITVVNATYINALSVCELLDKLAAWSQNLPITVVLDNARYQRCELVKRHATKLGIELLFLPTYSPNLNLIERLWKFVKKQCLYAKHYPNFASFTNAIEDCLRDTQNVHAKALRSLLSLNFQTFTKSSVVTA
jgi:transposase